MMIPSIDRLNIFLNRKKKKRKESMINGKIIMTRYHSTHDYLGFLKAAQTADSSFNLQQSEELNAAYFLKRPIITTLPTDQIPDFYGQQNSRENKKLKPAIKSQEF